MHKLVDVLKNKRFIGLVLLTLIVIVGIVLTVFLVNKNSTIQNLDIKEVGMANSYSFCVEDIKTTPKDGIVELEVYISIETSKDKKLKIEDFKIGDLTPKSADNFKRKLEKGEKNNFVLKYDIDSNRLLYLEFEQFKVALASVM